MPWIAANHRTEAAVSASAADKNCRPTGPTNISFERARRCQAFADKTIYTDGIRFVICLWRPVWDRPDLLIAEITQPRSCDQRSQPRKQTRNLTNQATLPAKKTVDKACWRCRSLGERALAITSGGRRADRASSVADFPPIRTTFALRKATPPCRKVSDEFTVLLCRGHHRDCTATGMKQLGGAGSESTRWKLRALWRKSHPLPASSREHFQSMSFRSVSNMSKCDLLRGVSRSARLARQQLLRHRMVLSLRLSQN